MIDFYKVITVTHHQVQIADIEDYVVKYDESTELSSRLDTIKTIHAIDELVYLSTCNRVSYIMFTKQDITVDFLRAFLLSVNPALAQKESGILDEHVSVYEGIEAVQYLFEVSCSIDSLVVGEREIFRQLRDAFDQSKDLGLSGDNMRILEKSTVAIAKKIYTSTRIGSSPLSVAALAMDTVLMHQPNKDAQITFVGAGETNRLMAKFFLKHQFTKFKVFNRSLDNALSLAKALNGVGKSLDQLQHTDLALTDILIVCTNAQSIIVSEAVIATAATNRTNELIVVDLSVPQNVSPNVAMLPKVKYIYIDELKALAAKNLDLRKQEVVLAKQLIQKAIPDFERLFAQRKLEIALADLPKEIKQLRKKIEEELYYDQISSLDDNAKEILANIITYYEKKAISIPIRIAKKSFNLE